MVDVCRQSLIASARLQNQPDPDFKYQTVDSITQFNYLRSGKIDVLCTPTTHTIDRRKREDVMFSLTVFITGADFLSRVDKPIETLSDLSGHRVSAVINTTTMRGLRDFVKQSEIDNIEIEPVKNHLEGVKKLELGLVHAHAGDQALLMRFRKSNPRFRLGGRLNSFEPYALAVRSSDLPLLNDIDQGLSALYRSGEIWDIFEKHFPHTEPSALLISAYILGGVPDVPERSTDRKVGPE